MKLTLIIVLIFTASKLPCFSKGIPAFKPEVYDMGKLLSKTVYEKDFLISNSGDEPYAIDSFRTTPRRGILTLLSAQNFPNPFRIHPNYDIKLRVGFNAGEIGEISEKLTVYSGTDSATILFIGKSVLDDPVIQLEKDLLVLDDNLQLDSVYIFDVKILNKSVSRLKVNKMYLKNMKNGFSAHLGNSSLYINDISDYTIRYKFTHYLYGEYRDTLVFESNDPINPVIELPFVAYLRDPETNITELSDTKQFEFRTLNSPETTEFILKSNNIFNEGIFAIYSQEGKLIKSFEVSGNSTGVSLTISKNELPKLSFIRFTQGERVYTHKYLKE